MTYIQWQMVALFLVYVGIVINTYLLMSGAWDKIFNRFYTWYDNLREKKNV